MDSTSLVLLSVESTECFCRSRRRSSLFSKRDKVGDISSVSTVGVEQAGVFLATPALTLGDSLDLLVGTLGDGLFI